MRYPQKPGFIVIVWRYTPHVSDRPVADPYGGFLKFGIPKIMGFNTNMF